MTKIGWRVKVKNMKLTAVITKEEEGFVSLCPESDIASQGDTKEGAKINLKEAVELFLECASKDEVEKRLSSESLVSSLEVSLA